ncbi:hypothetical protein BKA70DRAFT_514341 [Coprinopsis sp. MPI-PUGE-AT-0042]|nr:hypothetical protein BKA70DRAFT_514341 [Coprinopsis sp. MPI-PUGE-AT-0042]
MSQEPEDVKPKLNLNIAYEGQNITVKVKSNMAFSKIFDVVEKKFGTPAGTFKFVYDGTRLGKDDTPASVGMEDGDQVDAFLMLAEALYRPVHSLQRPQYPKRSRFRTSALIFNTTTRTLFPLSTPSLRLYFGNLILIFPSCTFSRPFETPF